MLKGLCEDAPQQAVTTFLQPLPLILLVKAAKAEGAPIH